MEPETVQPIQDNVWWIIPGKIAGVRRPTPEELPELQASGVGAIVSVMDDPANLDLYEQAKIPHLWLPTQGGTAPSRAQVEQLRDFVDQQNRIGNAVAVHCTSGRRRTGTMLAAYLISTGLSYENAIKTVLVANPDAELHDAQTTFLQALAES